MKNNNEIVISVGKKEKPITFQASGEALKSGIKYNEEIHKTFGVKNNGVLKGVYYFNSHMEANEHMDECIAKKIAKKVLG